jgi:hypothetical protein
MSKSLAKPNWFYIAPVMTKIVGFLEALNREKSQCGLILNAITGPAKPLLMSRLKGELLCLTSEQKVEDVRIWYFKFISVIGLS